MEKVGKAAGDEKTPCSDRNQSREKEKQKKALKPPK
jgi:hypothetical protein